MFQESSKFCSVNDLLERFQSATNVAMDPEIVENTDCASQTTPDYWLFANLPELAVLAPHFLPRGWTVVTFSTGEANDTLCLGLAHNIFHPFLKKLVCDRAIYLSQVSYAIDSGAGSVLNRFDGFRILCEQYYVGGPNGEKVKYESIAVLQYVSEILSIIETLDQKSSTLLIDPVMPSAHISNSKELDAAPDSTSFDNEKENEYQEEISKLDKSNFKTFNKIFCRKVSSKGRQINPTSRISAIYTENVGLCKNPIFHRAESEVNSGIPPPKDSVTISDSAGNKIEVGTLLEVEKFGEKRVLEDFTRESATKKTKIDEDPESWVVSDDECDVRGQPEDRDWRKNRASGPYKESKWTTRKKKKIFSKKKKTATSAKPQEETLYVYPKGGVQNKLSIDSDFDYDTTTSAWSCFLCSATFDDRDGLEIHLASHQDLKKFRCNSCGSRFTQKHNLTYHQRHVHGGERNFKCKTCGKAFMKGHDLKRHVLTHEPIRDALVCKYCNKTYMSQQNFDLHVADHEGNDKGYRWCLICGIKLRYHQHKYHMKKHQGPAECYDCSRIFNNVEILRQHIRQNHESEDNKFPCSLCKKTFRSKTHLTAHFRATHEDGSKLMQCHECLRSFSTKQQLQMHSTIHYEEIRSRRNTYKCPSCNLSFSANSLLRSHLHQSHSVEAVTDVEPRFVADDCDGNPDEVDDLRGTTLHFDRRALSVDGQTVFISGLNPHELTAEPVETEELQVSDDFVLKQFLIEECQRPTANPQRRAERTVQLPVTLQDGSTTLQNFTLAGDDAVALDGNIQDGNVTFAMISNQDAEDKVQQNSSEFNSQLNVSSDSGLEAGKTIEILLPENGKNAVGELEITLPIENNDGTLVSQTFQIVSH